jgi:mono/diheme cytochrome c family protein
MLDGERLFQAYCATCHGRSGKGDGPAAQALKTRPADLTLLTQRNGGAFPRDRVTRLVANGEPTTPAHGSKDMPVWGPLFEGLAPGSFQPVNPRIEDVVRYLESIQVK